jgi:putative thiamine transport system permease protein
MDGEADGGLGATLHEMTRSGGGTLRLAVSVAVTATVVLPIVLGLWETALPAFGILPAIGAEGPSLEPWRALVHEPGFSTSVRLAVTTGLGSTAIALFLAIGFCASTYGRVRLGAAEKMLAPLLAAPHAAMAIGIAFLIAPSGWLARLFSPWATGWTAPPDIAIVHDPFGLALITGLAVKEIPFFLLVILAALNQVPVDAHMAAGRALGYGRGIAWVKIIMPQVYRQIRPSVYVVLAFAMSAVDIAMVLGPGNPPPLAVQAMRWFASADIAGMLPATAAAMLQLVLVAAGIASWRAAEAVAAAAGRLWIRRGGRGHSGEPGLHAAACGAALLMAMGVMALLTLVLWSFAANWPFPDALPAGPSLANWAGASGSWLVPAINTASLAVLSTLMSLVLAVAWLEGEDRAGSRRSPVLVAAIYLPLLVPQVAFLFGLHVVLLRHDLNGSFAVLAWGHALFVFPYVMMALADPWRALDRRYPRTAAALGATPLAILVRVKLPILLRPVLTAAAIGFAVSVAQYLPTLVLGEGRVVTLTTEAVALSSGGDRRLVGVHATLQALLPLLAYLAAVSIPPYFTAGHRPAPGSGA